jgi:hypothetical protein
MSEQLDQPTARLAIVHAVVFAAGVLLLVVGLLAHVPQLLIVAGPCFVMAGLLVALGTRITFAGPIGSVLRAALGRTRVLTRYLRATLWILAGVLATAWGVERMRAGEHRGPPILHDFMIGQIPTTTQGERDSAASAHTPTGTHGAEDVYPDERTNGVFT